jgi:hypothetical protein
MRGLLGRNVEDISTLQRTSQDTLRALTLFAWFA